MPTTRRITAHFEQGDMYFRTPSGKHPFVEGTGPYEYLLGALSGCFTSTLYDICEGKVTFSSCEVTVTGIKRDESPCVLVDTTLAFTVKGASDEKLFLECLEETKKHCSIFQTISKVSRMHVEVEFVR